MRQRLRGFTLLEAMVALAILGVVLAIGMPQMSAWIYANKVVAASQFYNEGLALARNQALSQNSASRLVLTANAVSGQFDWQVDICFPRSGEPCNEDSGNWSTTDASAPDDRAGANGFKSVLRPADALAPSRELALSITPEEARAVYFTPLGWVDTAQGERIERIDLRPDDQHSEIAPARALVLTLAGIATPCKPDVDASNPQRCPP